MPEPFFFTHIRLYIRLVDKIFYIKFHFKFITLQKKKKKKVVKGDSASSLTGCLLFRLVFDPNFSLQL